MDYLKKEEILELDSLNSKIKQNIKINKPYTIGGDTKFGVIEKNKQKRINILHLVIHTLAFLLIVPFLLLILLGREIPREYSTIVSVVIGFYFGKSLLERE